MEKTAPQDLSLDSEKEMYLNISIAGTGYVGLSNAVLLAQHNSVLRWI